METSECLPCTRCGEEYYGGVTLVDGSFVCFGCYDDADVENAVSARI